MEKNIFWIAPIIVMAIGLAPMPYGYYTLLKLVVCGCSIYYAYHLYEKEDKTFVWVFGFFAVLYNPIIQACQVLVACCFRRLVLVA